MVCLLKNLMEFRHTLMAIGDSLSLEDIEVVKFLCRDVISRTKLGVITSAIEIFDELETANYLYQSKLDFLGELLLEAQRIDLMRKLNLSPQDIRDKIAANGRHFINEYTLMLHHLSENMVQSDVKQLKYLMKDSHIPRSLIDEASDAYSLFYLLEQENKLSSSNLNYLLQLMMQMDAKELTNIVNQCAEKHSNSREGMLQQNVSIQCSISAADSSLSYSLEYPCFSRPRGICLIINNQIFKSPAHQDFPNRTGTETDAAALEKVFKELTFQVETLKDLSRDNMVAAVRNVARRDHSMYDAFVCCILTHGEEGVLFGTDCVSVQISEILSMFTVAKCRTLENKPKVFFLQACQGKQVEEAMDQSIPMMDHGLDNDNNLVADVPDRSYMAISRMPRQPDFLLGLATVPGFVSWRSRSDGSWYIKALCDVLRKHHNKQDLQSMLTIVTDMLSQECRKVKDYNARQIPLPCSTLRKKLFLRTN